ncbi:related to alpha/beta hydrolase [Rhynchosporium secalis]|uniref:Related to alpha/beta hydrolase n=1 Tax=Rhynchosporium secalis TaxID=38038 RepID=A0A1E1M344_RHYSE|nr:related to alpha/beta hydrolase [Rhynchosporium secalis]
MPFQTINSTPVFYTTTPSTSSTTPPLTTLLIHGLGSSSYFYASIIPSLSPLTNCIALDTPGSGLSPLVNPDQTIDTIAEVALDLLSELKVTENVVLIGHSMGGIVASVLASKMGWRCKGVILLGPVDPGEGLKSVFEKRIEVVKTDGLEALANTVPTAATGTKSTPLHHAFIRSLILGTSSEGYISLCNAIANAKGPRYSHIRVPLLILAGEDDKTASVESAEKILKEYGTRGGEKEVKVLSGIGHWHCVESPEEVGRLIAEFVRTL